jgi:hypothetical protein
MILSHFHTYLTRVPGHQANNGPGSLVVHPEFMTSTVPPSTVRDWLRRPAGRITATFETPEQAADWHRRWMDDNPRPESYLFLRGPDAPQALDAYAAETAAALTNGVDRVDSFYSGGGEFVSLSFICCPSASSHAAKYKTCPEGRAA